MFLNFTNHPSINWSEKQINCANVYGEIVDFPFPMVDAKLTSVEIEKLATNYTTQILNLSPTAVLCQGEFTLAFHVISKLKSNNIKVLAACSKRVVKEVTENGITIKNAVFEFVQFREY